MRRSLILVLALLASVGTVALLEFGRPKPTSGPSLAEVRDTVHVLVYARDLPRGTVIDEASLFWQEQLRASLPQDALISEEAGASYPEDVIESVLRRDVLSGELVRAASFVQGAAGFMSLALTPGTRAVAIGVTAQKLAGGFILPEDRIDIIHTAPGDFNMDGRQGNFSQTILENIRVLAIGDTPTSRITFQTADQQDTMQVRKSDVNLLGDTITLEMTDAEAEVLFTALSSGQVSLALRALDDHGSSRIVSTIGFETNDPPMVEASSITPSRGIPQRVVEPAEQPNEVNSAEPARAVSRLVRIIQGGTTSYVEVPPPPALAPAWNGAQ